MANQFQEVHVVSATLTLTSTATVNSTVAIPAGAIVTGVVVQNNALLVGAGNITVVVDTVAQTAATAATLTNGNIARITPTSAVVTITSNNGGLIGVTTSTNTVGSVTVILTYIL